MARHSKAKKYHTVEKRLHARHARKKTARAGAKTGHSHAHTSHATRMAPERRELLHRAKRALRVLHRHVFFPKAVMYARGDLPEILNEIPAQALIEHWEALGELHTNGIEVKHTRMETPHASHLLREVELNSPVSTHARYFARKRGIIIKERRNPFHTTLERIFG